MTDMYNAGLMLSELTGYKRNMDTFGFAGDILIDIAIVACVTLLWFVIIAILEKTGHYYASSSVVTWGFCGILALVCVLGFCWFEYAIAEWKYEPLAETYRAVFGTLPWEA